MEAEERLQKIEDMEKRWEDYFKRRDRLDKTFWAKSAQMEDEYDALMAEWKEL